MRVMLRSAPPRPIRYANPMTKAPAQWRNAIYIVVNCIVERDGEVKDYAIVWMEGEGKCCCDDRFVRLFVSPSSQRRPGGRLKAHCSKRVTPHRHSQLLHYLLIEDTHHKSFSLPRWLFCAAGVLPRQRHVLAARAHPPQAPAHPLRRHAPRGALHRVAGRHAHQERVSERAQRTGIQNR
ncbi:hypothetical protein FOCC_FOCC008703 [Frankliniella occidentalis]|nr:hypothetical protein FOCC_FOCC008703 [Frankliniella occidentalis]